MSRRKLALPTRRIPGGTFAARSAEARRDFGGRTNSQNREHRLSRRADRFRSMLRGKLSFPMRIHSSPRKVFSLRSIAFAVLINLAAHAQAQQNSSQVEGRVEQILSQMTLEEKLSYISGEGFPLPIGAFNIKPIERLGLPVIYGIDGSLGIVGQGLPPGTRYPAGPLLASTWNEQLALNPRHLALPLTPLQRAFPIPLPQSGRPEMVRRD
jgi:hypothetical protein